MRQTKKNDALSRREALKALAAATGAITLTTLPSHWEKPVVEIGVLPVHAQASFAVIISNLVIDFIDYCYSDEVPGICLKFSFNYRDISSHVTAGSIIRHNRYYDIELDDSMVNVSGDSSNGTITVDYVQILCCAEILEVQLINAVGDGSNTLQGDLPWEG